MARRSSKMPVQLSKQLHDRLKDYADRHGEQIGTVLDGILREYLDQKVGKP